MPALAFRRPLSAYKLFPGQSEDRGFDVIQTPAIDRERMSATATICTPAVDRDGEVILPEGIDFESRYRLNPIVLWEHGFDAAIAQPIAQCEHPDGNLALVQSPAELVGTSYFTNRVKESEQTFALIDEGIVRATSVRVDPLPGTERIETRDGQRVLVMPKSTLIEWSWGCMGVNPETVRKCLDRGKLAGSPMLESIAKTLRPYAAMPRGRSFGAIKGVLPVDPNTDANAVAGGSPIVDKSATPPGSETPPGSPPPEEGTVAPPPPEEAVEEEGGEDDGMTPSGRVLSAVHQSITGLIANINGAANSYENPAAKEYLAGLVETLNGLATEVEGAFSEVAEGKSLTKSDGGTDPAPEEAVVKSWLASGKRRDLQLGGYGAQLASLCKAKNVLPAQRSILEGVCKHLRRIITEARTSNSEATAKAAKEAEDAIAAGLGKVVDVFKSISKELSDLIPKKK